MKRFVLGLLLVSAVGSAHAMKLGDFLKTLQNAQQPAGTSEPQGTTGQPATPAAQSKQDLLMKALVGGNVSAEQENEIGRQIAGNLLGAAPLVKDAAVQRYVN